MASPNPALKSVIILDACEAGAAETLKSGESERDTVIDQLEHAAAGTPSLPPSPAKLLMRIRDHGVLTYAFLEALNKDEGLPDDFVDLLTVTAHLEPPCTGDLCGNLRRSPAPKTDLKDNFPLGVRKPVCEPRHSFVSHPSQARRQAISPLLISKFIKGPPTPRRS